MPSRSVTDSRERRARQGLACALLLAASLGLATELESTPPLTAAVDCSYAVQVGTRVHCGESGPRRVSEACARAGLPGLGSADRLHAGDRVDPWQTCAHRGRRQRMAPAAIAALQLPVNVNEASRDELESLPGIGPKIAARVVEARPFAAVDDLLRVRGIGPVRLAGVRARAVVAWEP